jgi:uncharacterized protein
MTMDFPLPEKTPLNEPYWNGLAAGQLLFQRCGACGHAWLPPREECPRCLAAHWSWTPAAGGGKLVSWVVFRHAYHPAFADRVPYTVAIVELDEGPRLITNIVSPEGCAADRRVALAIEEEHGVALARFRLV